MENNVQFVNTGRRYVKRTVNSKISPYLKKTEGGFCSQEEAEKPKKHDDEK